MNKYGGVPATGEVFRTAVDAFGAFIEEHIAAFEYHLVGVALGWGKPRGYSSKKGTGVFSYMDKDEFTDMDKRMWITIIHICTHFNQDITYLKVFNNDRPRLTVL